jgi:hypothetical protein
MNDLDVANVAIALLDETPIDALNEDVKAARLIATHYDQTRRAELTKNLWSFALASASVIGDDIGSGDGTLNWRYAIPPASLRVLPLTYDGEFGGVPISYRVVGPSIFTDQESPRIVRFVQDVTDPDAWPPLFTEVMAAALAVKVAHPLTHKTGMIEIAQNAYQRALSDARRVNAMQSFGQLYTQSWAQARGDHRYWRA